MKTCETTGTHISLESARKSPGNFVLTKENHSQPIKSSWLENKKRFEIYRLEELQRKMNEGNNLDVKLISKKDSLSRLKGKKTKERITNQASDKEK